MARTSSHHLDYQGSAFRSSLNNQETSIRFRCKRGSLLHLWCDQRMHTPTAASLRRHLFSHPTLTICPRPAPPPRGVKHSIFRLETSAMEMAIRYVYSRIIFNLITRPCPHASPPSPDTCCTCGGGGGGIGGDGGDGRRGTPFPPPIHPRGHPRPHAALLLLDYRASHICSYDTIRYDTIRYDARDTSQCPPFPPPRDFHSLRSIRSMRRLRLRLGAIAIGPSSFFITTPTFRTRRQPTSFLPPYIYILLSAARSVRFPHGRPRPLRHGQRHRHGGDG